MVGRLARMRVSSVILPSSSGTLRSARRKTRRSADVDVANGLLVHAGA